MREFSPKSQKISEFGKAEIPTFHYYSTFRRLFKFTVRNSRKKNRKRQKNY